MFVIYQAYAAERKYIFLDCVETQELADEIVAKARDSICTVLDLDLNDLRPEYDLDNEQHEWLLLAESE